MYRHMGLVRGPATPYPDGFSTREPCASVTCCHLLLYFCVFFFSSRRRHTRFDCDWSSDVCSSDLLTTLLERTGQKMADVKMIHGRPALIQELTWWPQNIPGTSLRSDSVQQILFSFYNGELYKISVNYDPSSTEIGRAHV